METAPLLDGEQQVAVLDEAPVPGFNDHLQFAELAPLQAAKPEIIQVNIGKLCNQVCQHCHVDAGPHQTEANMDERTIAAVIDVIAETRPHTVDITGGAPEMNKHFRHLVTRCRELGVANIIDRCNLTALLLKSQRDLAEFLAANEVQVVASLPAINEKQTDAQRGDGIFDKSIKGLQLLNSVGYGEGGLELTLMSNPAGAFMPPPQEATEKRFRKLLRDRYDITFTRLIQLTNMPISRYLEWLRQQPGRFDSYMSKLSQAFNPSAVGGLMCLNTLSIGWDGQLYDCDFNQMLELPVEPEEGRSIFSLRLDALAGRSIVVGKHCLGCTAGQGSSCGGATAS